MVRALALVAVVATLIGCHGTMAIPPPDAALPLVEDRDLYFLRGEALKPSALLGQRVTMTFGGAAAVAHAPEVDIGEAIKGAGLSVGPVVEAHRVAYLTREANALVPTSQEVIARLDDRGIYEVDGTHTVSLSAEARATLDPRHAAVTDVLVRMDGARNGALAVFIDRGRPPSGSVELRESLLGEPVTTVVADRTYTLAARILPTTRVVVWMSIGGMSTLLWASEFVDAAVQMRHMRASVYGEEPSSPRRLVRDDAEWVERGGYGGPFELRARVLIPQVDAAVDTSTMRVTLLSLTAPHPNRSDLADERAWRAYLEALPRASARELEIGLQIAPPTL